MWRDGSFIFLALGNKGFPMVTFLLNSNVQLCFLGHSRITRSSCKGGWMERSGKAIIFLAWDDPCADHKALLSWGKVLMDAGWTTGDTSLLYFIGRYFDGEENPCFGVGGRLSPSLFCFTLDTNVNILTQTDHCKATIPALVGGCEDHQG